MKALTLKQPWASLVANGDKKFEFRKWKTNYRGPVLIHAGCGFEKDSINKFDIDYPKSRFIAIADIIDCLEVDDDFNDMIISLNSSVYGNKRRTGYVWILDNIRKINYDVLITLIFLIVYLFINF